MRIAIYHNLPSGGAKRTLHELTRRLSASHQVEVYSLSSADHEFGDLRPLAAAHHVFEFRPTPLLRSPFGRLNQVLRLVDLARIQRVSRRIARRIDAAGYDVVFVHPCRLENSPSVLRYLTRAPSVFFCQEPLRRLYEPMPDRPYEQSTSAARRLMDRIDPLPKIYHATLKWLDRRNIRRAGSVLVNSEHMRARVEETYQIRTSVNYLGVDTDAFRPQAVAKRPLLVSVGSLTPLKEFDFLIRSVARIPVSRRPALIIASNFANPPERVFLEGLAAELGVELGLLEGVTDQDLVMIYNQASVTVYSPIREPFGLVPLESMACGTPVVAVREGGIPETVLDGTTGLLVRRDEDAFAEAVWHLLTRPSLAAEYGRNGRSHVQGEWSWDGASARVETHLSAAALSCK